MRNIIIIAIVVILLGLGYKLFFTSDEKTPEIGLVSNGVPVTAGSQTAGVSAGVETEFLSVLLNLKTLKLDDSVFSRDSFRSLQDFSKPLVQTDPEGRPNPFSPIGSDPQIIVPGAPVNKTIKENPVSSGQANQPASISVVTNPVSDIASGTATFSGVVSSVPEGAVSKASFWLGTTEEVKTHVDAPNFSIQEGTFSLPITNLRSNVKYFVRAVVVVNGENHLGEIVSFTTLPK